MKLVGAAFVAYLCWCGLYGINAIEPHTPELGSTTALQGAQRAFKCTPQWASGINLYDEECGSRQQDREAKLAFKARCDELFTYSPEMRAKMHAFIEGCLKRGHGKQQ